MFGFLHNCYQNCYQFIQHFLLLITIYSNSVLFPEIRTIERIISHFLVSDSVRKNHSNREQMRIATTSRLFKCNCLHHTHVCR
jgi:hypothetical protein